MNNTFGQTISTLRTRRNLTVQELADRAKVPSTLISGLQNHNRTVGEHNADKIGRALNLTGAELENFIYLGINNCTERVLERNKNYPAELINLLCNQLHEQGINWQEVSRCVSKPDDAVVVLNNGTKVHIETKIIR